jgi:hypothetical protein
MFFLSAVIAIPLLFLLISLFSDPWKVRPLTKRELRKFDPKWVTKRDAALVKPDYLMDNFNAFMFRLLRP